MTAAQRKLIIPTAAAFVPLLESHRYKGIRGGRAKGASHFFGDRILALAATNPGLRVACLREVQKTLKRSSKLLIEDTISHFGLTEFDGFKPRADDILLPGGGFAIFQGLSDHTNESIKSLEGFDIFSTDEAQTISDRSLSMLRPTARSTPRTVLEQPELWFGWNPTLEDDPVEVFFNDHPPDSVLVEASYADNPWFPEELRKEMEWDRLRDPDKYNHVWLGKYQRHSAARVFSRWSVEEFDVPGDVFLHWGADWGFSVDPSVLIGCFVLGRKLYVAYEAYAVGCEIEDTPALFDTADPDRPGLARDWSSVADSARPETISYMKRHGYGLMQPARKGPGSLHDGIQFLKNYDIIVHPRCVHTADELTFYSYKVDKKTQKVSNILEDKKNHVIDALRYAVEAIRVPVEGGVHAQAGHTETNYDGQVAAHNPTIAADVGYVPEHNPQEYGIPESFGGHEWDGGLT